MSRSHHSHHSLHSTHPSSSRSVERSTPSGPKNAHPDPFGPIRQDLARLTPASANGGYLSSFGLPPKPPSIKGAFGAAFHVIQTQLGDCKLNPVGDRLRQELFGDVWALWELLRAVVEAQFTVAETIRLVVNHDRNRDGRWDPDVEYLLKPAGEAIRHAIKALQRFYERAQERSRNFSKKSQIDDVSIMALYNWMVTRPTLLDSSSFQLDLHSAGRFYEPQDRMRMEDLFKGATIAKTAHAVSEIVFSSMGRGKDRYTPPVTLTAATSIKAIDNLLREFRLIPSFLRAYYSSMIQPSRYHEGPTTDTDRLLGVADFLHKHVQECINVAESIKSNVPVPVPPRRKENQAPNPPPRPPTHTTSSLQRQKPVVTRRTHEGRLDH